MGTNDQGKSNVFGEGLPGTGGDYIDTNDTEGHKGNTKYEPPRADGGPDDFLRTKPIPNLDGSEEDTEGHRGRGVRIPNADGSPDDFMRTRPIPNLDGSDVEGHGADGGPDDFLRTKPIPNLDGSEEDVEGHRGRGGRIPTADGSDEGAGPDGVNNDRYKGNRIDGTDEDVEGHLYTGGPSTQGEFSKRAPSDSPHGER